MMMSSYSAKEEEGNGEQTIAPGPGLDTVADLERKLAMLRTAETNNHSTADSSTAAPAFALPTAEVKTVTAENKGGKSALLVSLF